LISFMTLQGLIAPDQRRVHYCGFISWQQYIIVFMPRNCDLGTLDVHHARYLLQALSRYYLDKNTGVVEGQSNELIGNSSLSLAQVILEDYRANGLYVRRKKHFSINEGRTNWKRTIARRLAYPSEDSHVYPDIETSSTRYVSDCEISKIHAQVIRKILRKYGALLSSDYLDSNHFLDRMLKPKWGREYQLAMLDRELTESYSERDMRLIEMLKAFIEDRSAAAGNELLVGTRMFHNVWEGMLDKCLPRKVDVNNALPVPYYQKDSRYIELPQKGQRTDTVIDSEDGSLWAVIDAKYYDATTPNLAPGWHDLVKQFFYKTAAEAICDSDILVSLHFIFPGTIHHLQVAKVGQRGQKNVKEDNFREVDGYGEIFCHYCDPIIILEKYARGQYLEINNPQHITGEIFPNFVSYD